MRRLYQCFFILSVFAVFGCGSDDEVCDPIAQTGCEGGLACETVEGSEEPQCVAPVVIRGIVFDLADSEPIEGADVVAVDANGAPVSSVATSDANGEYDLRIPSPRDADEQPLSLPIVTLRSDATGYQTFPSGLRRALPIDTSTPVEESDALVVQSSLTDIGLLALPGGEIGGTISGTVEAPPEAVGVLVVAESGGAGLSAIADLDGDYRIFNVPDGDHTVNAYARDANYVAVDASVAGDEVADVDLSLSGDDASTVTGRVEIVDPGAGSGTSVIFVVESTFDATLGRGEAVPGLRSPEPGIAPDVTGEFTVEGVPGGNYVILAAFEDDFLVRDPDSCIAGTDFVRQAIAPGVDLTIEDSFKITGSLDVIGPGAAGAEEVTGNPTLTWVDDASEDEYSVVVFDSFGEIVFETTTPGTSGENPAVAYGGPALQPGMFYQFRATSTRTSGNRTCEIAQTEDLKGVFFIPAE